MGKLLATINYNDNYKLNKLSEQLGLFIDNDAVWAEAKEEFDNGNDEAEIRIKGLDHIIITNSKGVN